MAEGGEPPGPLYGVEQHWPLEGDVARGRAHELGGPCKGRVVGIVPTGARADQAGSHLAASSHKVERGERRPKVHADVGLSVHREGGGLAVGRRRQGHGSHRTAYAVFSPISSCMGR